jgi:hypothetical protein
MRILVALVVFVAIGLAVTWDRWRETKPARPGAEATAETDAEPRGATPALVAGRREIVAVRAEGGLLVRVVDETGAPVGGAEVRHSLLEPRAEDGTVDAALWTHDRPAAVARFGNLIRADARGEVVIPVPDSVTDSTEGGMYMCALDAGRLAEGWALWREARGHEITLRLELDRELVAQLLDHDGRPVQGVGLEARHAQVDEILGPRDRWRALGTTDDEGLVHMRHVQTWWSSVHAPDGLRRVVVGPALPGLGEVGTEVLLRDPMPERVVVRLPATGRIRIVVEDLPGDAAQRPRVELSALDAAGKIAERAPTTRALDPEGEALFDRVAVHRAWQVRLMPSMTPHVFPGPRAAGEEVVQRLVSPSSPILVGRLMADGVPLADRRFSIYAGGERMPVRAFGRTGTDGRFRIERHPPEVATRLTDLHWLVVDPTHPDALGGTSATTATLIAGENDLGDIVVSRVAPLLTGRIVGDLDGVSLLCEASNDEGAWSAVPSIERSLAPDGSFALHGAAPAPSLRLVVHSPKTAPCAPIPFTVGQRDLIVTLEPGGGIAVAAVLGDARGFVMLAPRVVPVEARGGDQLLAVAGARGLPGWDRSAPATKDFLSHEPLTLRYVWDGLPAGRYRVEFRGWDFGSAALEIPDVEVRPGAQTVLERVDLRDRIRWVTLRFPALQRPDARARLAAQGLGSFGHLFVMGPDGPEHECISIDGDFEFLALTQPLDVVVDAHGHRREMLRGVSEDLEVQLEPGLPVELGWNAPFEVPDGGAVILTLTPGDGVALPRGARVRSRAAGGSLGPYRPPTVACTRDGETFRAAVTAPGTYALSAALRAPTGRTEPLRITPARIDVPEAGARATVTLSR